MNKNYRNILMQRSTCCQLVWLSLLMFLQSCASDDGSATTAGSNNSLNSSVLQIESKLFVCPMKVSNTPPVKNRQVLGFFPFVMVKGVQLMSAPMRGACLSSGFGRRGGRLHKGVDYHQRPGGPVFAGGDGRIIEATYHPDYGNMVLLEHGSGVFTRYAHLKKLNPGIKVGKRVRVGSALGVMGKTGRTSAVHLHYEILIGNYNNPNRSFGLKAINPLR